MKKTTLKFVMTMLMALFSLYANAYDAKIDGIYYNFDTSNKTATVTYLRNNSGYSYAYSGAVNIPATVTYNEQTYDVISIGSNAFNGCSGLTAVDIPNSVTSIGISVFSYCSSLTTITVASDNPKYDSRNNCNAIIETSSHKLVVGCKNTTIPNSVTSIGECAFYGCSGLTAVDIPSSVTSIGYEAFYNCSGLTSVSIPNSVTSIGDYTFKECI